MTDKNDIVERLYRRFKGVPNFEMTDAEELVEESLIIHGLSDSANIPADKISLVMLYAQMQGAWQVAFSVAHYFKFTDGEESIDKTMVADNYRKLAKDSQKDYDIELGKIHGNNFRIMPRIDRPNTTPPTGESRRGNWRKY